jgi:glycosyltransferase involved in cell wall biosynthesis
MSITILYTYRNRDLIRIKRSLDSLVQQVSQNFKVVFIDYGSEEDLASQVKMLTESYDFASYEYLFTRHQPWNKGKALNYAIKKIDSDYCFNADVDMIFHPEFTSIIEKKINPNKLIYFQVGFLSQEESVKSLNFNDYKINLLTNNEATGMTIFSVAKLKSVHGFDEFFHFWGSEDTDIHNRLKTYGCEIEFYNSKLLMLHQWHNNYRRRETKKLNSELQLSGIVELNHKHLQCNLKKQVVEVNSQYWGQVINKDQFYELQSYKPIELLNKKTDIDYFLYQELPNLKQQTIAITIKEDQNQSSIKYKIKKYLGKKVPEYYSLKQINDMFLLHIISFYHSQPYSYEISPDLEKITFKIKK